MAGRPAYVVEGMLAALLLAAPWPHGCAPDSARFALSAALLAAAAVWAAGRRPSPGGRGPWAAFLAPPAVLVGQLLLGRSVAPVFTAEAGLVMAAMLGGLIVTAEVARAPGALLRLSAAVLASAAAQAAFGAVQWSGGPSRIYGVARPDVTMPFGSFVNHNNFAGLMEMSALLALGMAAGHAARARQPTPASIGLAALGLALVAVEVASRSRGGLLALSSGLLLGALLFGFYLRPERTRFSIPRALVPAAIALAIVVFGLAAASPTARRHAGTLWAGLADSSFSYRFETAQATLRLAASRPLLGSGFGAYEDAVPRFKRGHGAVRTTHAESDALEVLAEGGLAGAGAFAWLGLALFRRARERLGSGRDPFRKGLAIGAASGALAMTVHSWFDFNLRIPSNALVFVVLLGLTCAPVRSSAVPPQRRDGRQIALALLFSLLALAAGYRAHGAWRLEAALTQSRADARIEGLDAVLAAHPYLAEAWRARGTAWRALGARDSPLRAVRLETAARDLRATVRLRPSWAEAWSELGWLRAMQGDRSGAARDLDHAIGLDPTHEGIQHLKREFAARTGG